MSIYRCFMVIIINLGEFGKVYKGTWVHNTKNGDTVSQVVAVKTIKSINY